MAGQIYTENTRKLLQDKSVIESNLNVKINIKNKIVTIEGKAEDEFKALEFIEAINLGFSIKNALKIKEENIVFKKIHIKNITKRKSLSQVRARIIGEKRKALNTIESLTNCSIVLHDNVVGIIGEVEEAQDAVYAIKSIIAGSKHSNVYSFLEKRNAKKKIMGQL